MKKRIKITRRLIKEAMEDGTMPPQGRVTARDARRPPSLIHKAYAIHQPPCFLSCMKKCFPFIKSKCITFGADLNGRELSEPAVHREPNRSRRRHTKIYPCRHCCVDALAD